MRFPKETRAEIHQAAPHPATITWPPGAGEPQPGRLYWVQSAEDLEAERKRREESPETHAEVIAGMKRRAGLPVAAKTRKRRRATRGPIAGSERIYVIATEVLDPGWKAKVVIWEDPDPVHHLQIKTKEPVDTNSNMGGPQFRTRTEPEQLPLERSRIEEEDALRIEHKASVNHASVLKAEQHLNNQRRKGRRSKLAEEAVARAKKRAAQDSAA